MYNDVTMRAGYLITGILGWLLLAAGVFLTLAEPHTGRGLLAIAGTLLIGAERIAGAIRERPSSAR